MANIWISGPKGNKKLHVTDGCIRKADLAVLAIAVGPGYRLHLAGTEYGLVDLGCLMALRAKRARLHPFRCNVNGSTKKDYYRPF